MSSLHDVHKLTVYRRCHMCVCLCSPLLVSFNLRTAGHILMNFYVGGPYKILYGQFDFHENKHNILS